LCVHARFPFNKKIKILLLWEEQYHPQSKITLEDVSTVKRFWILDLRFWIDPVHKGTGLGDFRLSILDLFRPNMAGLEPKNNSIFQNPKSQIGTVKKKANTCFQCQHPCLKAIGSLASSQSD
jgi:hypothetical protein